MCQHRNQSHKLLCARQMPKPLGHQLPRIYSSVINIHGEHNKHLNTLDMDTWTGEQLIDA